MNQWAPVSRRVSVAFSIILAISLVTGLIPVSAFADTSAKVKVEAPKQISETANIADTRPAQVGGEVALAAGTTTVLDNGLVFVIDNVTNTAAVTGWYGTQPTENLVIPQTIAYEGKLATVNILGGGGGSMQP